MCCPNHPKRRLTEEELDALYEQRKMKEAYLTAQFQARNSALLAAYLPPGLPDTEVGPAWARFLSALNEAVDRLRLPEVEPGPDTTSSGYALSQLIIAQPTKVEPPKIAREKVIA